MTLKSNRSPNFVPSYSGQMVSPVLKGNPWFPGTIRQYPIWVSLVLNKGYPWYPNQYKDGKCYHFGSSLHISTAVAAVTEGRGTGPRSRGVATAALMLRDLIRTCAFLLSPLAFPCLCKGKPMAPQEGLGLQLVQQPVRDYHPLPLCQPGTHFRSSSRAAAHRQQCGSCGTAAVAHLGCNPSCIPHSGC